MREALVALPVGSAAIGVNPLQCERPWLLLWLLATTLSKGTCPILPHHCNLGYYYYDHSTPSQKRNRPTARELLFVVSQ